MKNMTAPSGRNSPVTQNAAWKNWLILALISILSVASYLAVSAVTYRVGFPLDDSWIHQTYARNLALLGEWSFIPGQPSGGSTSPLWSAMLAIGFWLKLGPYVWAYTLGAAALWGIAVLGERTIRGLVPLYAPRFPWVGAAIALEWHLDWAAASGMETLLYTLLVTAVLVSLISGSRKFFSLGLLVGLSVWVRPDGITLLGPVILVLLLASSSRTGWLRELLNLALGFGSLFAFYLLFNLIISGSPWPNTFYAKQAEYAVYMENPFLSRFGNEALQPLIGIGIVLLAGAVLATISAIRKRSWGVLAAAAWVVGFLALYAWRLPVTYQHGRYVIPVMPIFFLLGLGGLVEFSLVQGSNIRRLVTAFWKITTALVLLVFWGRGAFAYAQDVAVIESEMVVTAKWVSQNLPSRALVAAHDIGALGYFGNHDLVDLAGLVSPDVVPFLRDENRIASYLSARHVDYLVTFPDWYPQLVKGLDRVFTTNGTFAPAFGETNMAVYRWPEP
jgi:hypothetical protein